MAGAADELASAPREVEGEVATEVAVSLAGHPRLVEVDARILVGQGDDKGLTRAGQEKEEGGGIHPLPLLLLPDSCVLRRRYLADQAVQYITNKVENGAAPAKVHGGYPGQ